MGCGAAADAETAVAAAGTAAAAPFWELAGCRLTLRCDLRMMPGETAGEAPPFSTTVGAVAAVGAGPGPAAGAASGMEAEWTPGAGAAAGCDCEDTLESGAVFI